MNKFTWTAKDKNGRKVVRELTATTAEEAKATLIAEGCTDLVLREDEVMHAAQEGFTDKSVLKIFDKEEEIKISAADRVKVMEQSQKSGPAQVLDTIVQDKGLYALGLLAIGYQIYRQHIVTAICFGIALLCWPVFRVWMSLPLYYYRKLTEARDWNRWEEVLRLVDRCEIIRQKHIVKLPAVELARSRSRALAGLGRLPQAIEEMNKWENQPGHPSWMHKAHLAGLHDTAKLHDQAIEYNRLAIAENPTPVMYADLMNRYLRYKRDPVNARLALAEVEKGTLTEVAKPFVTRCRGILAYLEGDDATAKKELEDAIAAVEPARTRPFRDGHLAIARAYLCCVLARQGDLKSAQKAFAQAKEYLVATDEKELLAECRSAIGAA